MNLHAFYRGKIAIENNFSDISRMKRLFTP